MALKLIIMMIAATGLFGQTILLFRDIMLAAFIIDLVGLLVIGGWLFH